MPEFNKDLVDCSTCSGTGRIDQRIGGRHASAYAQCPDCRGGGTVEVRKAVRLDGFVLIDHRGTPKMWAPESTRLISTYALIKKRIILDDGDYQIERERMKKDGWSIKEASMTVEVKGGGA